MTFEDDGLFGLRLRALDVSVPPSLGRRVLAAENSPTSRRPGAARRAARAAAILAAFLVVNAAAFYMLPVYALAVTRVPLAGGPSSALLQAVGLRASDGTTPIGATATAAGQHVTLIAGTADALRTVLLLGVTAGEMIPPRDISVTDQFGHSYTASLVETGADGTTGYPLVQSGDTIAGWLSPTIPARAPGQLALVLPPITGPAASVGARLTVSIDTLAQNNPTASPWDHQVHGPWTLTASLVPQPGSALPIPGPQTVDGITWRLSGLSEAGGVLEVSGSVSGPSVGQDGSAFQHVQLRTASGTQLGLLYGSYDGTTDHLDFDLTFARPPAGTAQLQIGQAAFTIVS